MLSNGTIGIQRIVQRKPTAKQRKTLIAIEQLADEFGHPPTLHQVAARMGKASQRYLRWCRGWSKKVTRRSSKSRDRKVARTRKKPEPLPALMHDAGSEKALLSLIFRHGLNELVEALDPADFADPWHNWIFRELRLMWESGIPLDCGAAAARWFADPACGVRAKEAGVTETPAYVTAYVFKEEFVSLAHKDWLVQQLRKQRMRRWLAQLPGSIEKWNKENQDNPIATLQKAQRAINTAWARAAEVFPEELLCDD